MLSSVPITRSERRLVAGWSVMLLAIAAAPVINGHRLARSGWSFVGFVGDYFNDYYSYLAWIRQAADGAWLFRDLFTTEPHDGVFFHPLFWVIGRFSGSTGLSPMVAWYLFHGVGIVMLAWAIYRLAAIFTGDRATRFLALVLATSASGLGWLVGADPDLPAAAQPIDLWLVESDLFRAWTSSFMTLPLSAALFTLSLVYALELFRDGNSRSAVRCGLAALGLAMTHQYDMVGWLAVLAAWALLWRSRAGVALRPGGLLVAVAIPLPFCLYSVAVVRFSEVFSRVTWEMPRPALAAHALGWGLPLILAVAALALPAVRRSYPGSALLGVWLAVHVVLSRLPLGFERKLIWGATIPLCLLAAMATVEGVRRLRRGATPRLALCVLVAAFCAIGSVRGYAGLFESQRAHSFGHYLPDSYREAIGWIDQNTLPGAVVMATPGIAPMLPGRAGVTVFYGHWAQTLDAQPKRDLLMRLFGPPGAIDPATARETLDRHGVDYVVLDAVSVSRFGLASDPATLVFVPWVRPVFRNDAVVVWQVESP